MPIEILELVVKAKITDEKVTKTKPNIVQKQINELINKQQLVEEIVEQVCAILEYKNER